MKYSNTAITQLTRWYKQILIKCAIFNAAILMGSAVVAAPANAYEPVDARTTVKAGETVTIDGKSYTGLPTVSDGGAVYNQGTLTVNNSSFSDNTATSRGGAIANTAGATLTITDSVFNNNTVQSSTGTDMVYGGAIDNTWSTGKVYISNSTFTGNKALRKDGATGSGVKAYSSVLYNGGTASLTDVTLKDNVGQYMGGVIQNGGGNLTLTRVDFEDSNNLDGEGTTSGASVLLINEGTVNITDSTFKNNYAGLGTDNNHYDEGVINVQGVNAIVNFKGNNIFEGNHSTALGIDSYQNAVVTFADGSVNEFSGNTAQNGAAIRNYKRSYPQYNSTLVFEDSTTNTFSNNTAVTNGGAVYNDNATTINGTFKNNKAGNLGGAIYNASTGTVNINGASSFSGNTDSTGANDIYNLGAVNFENGENTTVSLEGGINGSSENKGTVNINGLGTVAANSIKNQNVSVAKGELHLNNANLEGSNINVASGATLNSIDDALNAYTQITLENGANFKADFGANASDTFKAAASSTLNLTALNILEGFDEGTTKEYTIASGANIDTNAKAYTGGYKYTAQGNTDASGKVSITNAGNSLINDAVEDTESGNKTNITYDMATNETYFAATGDDAKIQNSNFVLEGNGKTLEAVSGATGIEVADNSDVTIKNLAFSNFDTDYALKNNAGSTLRIYDSHFDSSNKVAINNAGTLYSDPTTYETEVINSGTATFDSDTFTSTATLSNSGVTNLIDTTFKDGSEINGNGGTGTLNFTGGTTKLGATVEDNNLNIQNGASVVLTESGNIDGLNLANDTAGGTIDLRNKRLDNLNSTSLSSALNVLMDINLNTGKSDNLGTITGTGGLNLQALELLALGGDSENVQIATAGTDVSLSASVMDTLKTYYDNVDYNSATGVLSLSGKASPVTDLIGSWGSGNYIKAYNAADAANTSVGANLTILDNQVKTNADAIATKQAKLTAGDGMDATAFASDTLKVQAADGTVVVGTDGVKVGTIQTDNIANKAVTTAKIADGAVMLAKLGQGVQNNLLLNTDTSAGLTVTAGSKNQKAKIALNLASTGGLEENDTNGLQIKEGGVQLAMINADAMTSAAVAAAGTGTKLVNETSLGATRGAIETKLNAGATGYDINAKTLKVAGNDVLSTANVAGTYTDTSARGTELDAKIKNYVDNNGDKFASVANTTNVITELFKDKALYIQETTGMDQAHSVAYNYNQSSQELLHGATSMLNADEILAGAIATKQAQLKNDADTPANIDATVLTSIRGVDTASDTSLVTEKAIATKLATKQDTLTAGNGIDITSNTVSVKLAKNTSDANVSGLTTDTDGGLMVQAADGTVVVDENGVKVGTIQTDNIANKAVTTAKIADGAVMLAKLGQGVQNNLLVNTDTSAGLTVTAGSKNQKAKIALNLASTGGLEENDTNGLQIKEGGVQLAMINADAMTSAAVAETSTGTKLVNETSLGATRSEMETKLNAGATGYDINAKTLKVAGNAVLSTADVAEPYSGTTIDEANAYITTNAAKFANVGTTAGVINTIFKDKQDWLDGTLGITSANPDAVKTEYTGTNYLTNATTLTGADKLLDKTINDVSTIVGNAQTTAATTGQFKDRKIGADINLVNAVDELGKNMVSLSEDNVFTGLNTFKNDGGIALQDSAGGNSTRLKATTDGLSVDRNVEATGFKIAGQAPVVTSIDTDGTTVTSAATAANVMATSATVYNGAEKGKYTGAKVNGDTATTHTISSAIAATNSALNNVLTTAGTEIDSAKVDVQWKGTDSTLATVLGTGDYSSNNYVEDGASVTTAVGALDTALKTANDTIGARAIEAGTAGTLTGKTIGTAAGNISVVDALETLNATNVNQNSGLNSLATLINGGSVDAATGAYTAGTATLSNKFTATNLVAAANELLTDITVTADGNYIKADKTAAENLGILDGQIKAYTDKVEVVGAPETAKVSDGGLLDGRAITGDTTVDGNITLVQAVRDISATAAGKALNNTFTGNNEFQGTTTFTGATQFNNASNTFGSTSGSQVIIDNGGNVQVDKKLTLGGANAISGSENTLDMGKNALTNIAGLTLVNGSADVALNADASGNLVVDNGVIANSFTVGTTGKGFDASGNATTGTLKIGDANPITGTSNALNMNGNDLTNVKDLTTTGNAKVGGNLNVDGDANLNNATVKGTLTISDGAATPKTVNMSIKTVTADGNGVDVLEVAGNTLATGTLATSDHLKVVKPSTTDVYSTVFDVDADGNMTADGESKFAKDTSGVYSLDVTDTAVTANKEIDAKAGVKFGTDDKAMTSVEQGAVAALNATGNDQKLVSAQSLAATRDAINADTRKVMGSMYNINDDKTVSYNNAALAGTNGFATGAASLTGALTKFANNVQAAMGTTYAADGTYTNGFAKPDAVDYDGLATNQSLVAAISQLDKNIGTAIAGTDRSSDAFDTSATKTVNENIAALDAVIGGDVKNEFNGVAKTQSINQNIDAISATLGRMDNLSTEAQTADSAVVTRGNLTNANNTALDEALTVADALSNIDQTLGRIHGLYDGSTVNVTDSNYPSVTGANSNLAIGTTVENHLVSLDNAIGSRNIASANDDINKAVNGDATAADAEARHGSLALGLQTVGDKIGDMDFASTHYIKAGSDLSSSVKTLDDNLYRLDNEVKDLRKDMNRGLASMAALTALVPNARATGNTQLSVGTGMYSGHTGFALGGFHWFTDNLLMNVGVAYGDGDSSDVVYRAGVTYSW